MSYSLISCFHFWELKRNHSTVVYPYMHEHKYICTLVSCFRTTQEQRHPWVMGYWLCSCTQVYIKARLKVKHCFYFVICRWSVFTHPFKLFQNTKRKYLRFKPRKVALGNFTTWWLLMLRKYLVLIISFL